MKRLLVLLTSAALLVGCGAVQPTPSTGQLLGAPTTLNMTGQSLSAQAAPRVNGATFQVRVTVTAPRQTLPPFTVTDLYVVTGDGVWSAPVKLPTRSCGNSCALSVASGPARGLQKGRGAQVVLALRDLQGRTYLLRDASVRLQ